MGKMAALDFGGRLDADTPQMATRTGRDTVLMNNRLICPKCKNLMNWKEFEPEYLLALVKGEELVIADCPKCDHKISLEPADIMIERVK